MARQRTEDIFAVIRDFPDSQPAIADLRAGLAASPALQRHLVSCLRAANRRRLLQAGAPPTHTLSTQPSPSCPTACWAPPLIAAGHWVTEFVLQAGPCLEGAQCGWRSARLSAETSTALTSRMKQGVLKEKHRRG